MRRFALPDVSDGSSVIRNRIRATIFPRFPDEVPEVSSGASEICSWCTERTAAINGEETTRTDLPDCKIQGIVDSHAFFQALSSPVFQLAFQLRCQADDRFGI